jgi:DNA-binding NarL/FixJ family response regulator
MFAAAAALSLPDGQKQLLESLARSGTTPQRLARKCEVILLSAQGLANNVIAKQIGLSRPTVIATRAAFQRAGVDALRRGKKRKRSRPVLDA